MDNIQYDDLTGTTLSILFIVGLIAASLWILGPFLPAVIWATMIVVATWPLMLRVQTMLWGRRSLAVAVTTIALLLVFVVPFSLAISLPFPLADKADPSDTGFMPVPVWYFLFDSELLKHVNRPLEPLATRVLPGLAVIVMLPWPFLDRQKTVRAPTSRPIGMALGVSFLVVVFSLLGISLKNLYGVTRLNPGLRVGRPWLQSPVAQDATGFTEQVDSTDPTCPIWTTNGQIEHGTISISAIRLNWLNHAEVSSGRSGASGPHKLHVEPLSADVAHEMRLLHKRSGGVLASPAEQKRDV